VDAAAGLCSAAREAWYDSISRMLPVRACSENPLATYVPVGTAVLRGLLMSDGACGVDVGVTDEEEDAEDDELEGAEDDEVELALEVICAEDAVVVEMALLRALDVLERVVETSTAVSTSSPSNVDLKSAPAPQGCDASAGERLTGPVSIHCPHYQRPTAQ